MIARIASIFCAALVLFAAAPADAEVSVGASPAFVDMELEPGRTSAQTVLLFNSGKDPVTVRAYAWDWWHDATNPKKFAAPGTLPHSAANWISFVPANVTVLPGKAVNVTITVATPKTAKGGAYAVAWFEAIPKENKKSKELRVGARLGVLVMTQVKGKSRPAITVDKLDLHPPTASQVLRANILLRNTGDVHVFPKGTLVVLDKKNKLVGHATFEKRRMLPEEISTAAITWGGELRPGDYQAVLTVDYGDAGATVKTLAFSVSAAGGTAKAAPAAGGTAKATQAAGGTAAKATPATGGTAKATPAAGGTAKATPAAGGTAKATPPARGSPTRP